MDPGFHDTFLASAPDRQRHGRRLGGNASLGTWMGETGGCYNSGHYNMSNAFMDAFWYLESLAGFARNGATAFCRQTLLGGNYELVGKDTLSPNPDFYAAALPANSWATVLTQQQQSSPIIKERVRGGDDGGERLDGGDQGAVAACMGALLGVTTDDGTAGDSSTRRRQQQRAAAALAVPAVARATSRSCFSTTAMTRRWPRSGCINRSFVIAPAVGAAAAAAAEAAASSDPSSDSRAPPARGGGLLFGQLYLMTGGDDGEDRLLIER